MKLLFLLFFLSINYINVYAQFGPEQIITTNASLANSVYASDLDGDGDIDVLSASFNDDKIAWYENIDGQGNFETQNIITTDTDGAFLVYSSDLDGDGDMDILSASSIDHKIAWYENTDGQGNFGNQQVISINALRARSVYTEDLDGDSDMDVLSASFDDHKIAWYENTNGQGSFGEQQIITTDAEAAFSVFASDLDGDGDIDVLSASQWDSKIAWYENTDGQGNFGLQKIITINTFGATSVYASDLDGDGDIDVLSSSLDDKIAWYENMDGLGNFGPQQIITTIVDKAESVYASDLDGDGDMDILSASFYDDKIAWYENMDGQGTFSTQRIISINADGAREVYASDLDGDGDMDVLSASWSDHKIAWYENLGILSINENKFINVSIYPNPTTSILTIKSGATISQLNVYNKLGQLVLSNSLQNSIDLSELSQGIYLIKIKYNNGNLEMKKIVKE